ncbi:MAG: type II toxin-antitoxin system PemK/MazF family toxin [Armatimonadetes bacterium]|nr:type II toxin-antitoxin system PemK/MazF family toxin [Armatimonadota bacterium]
MNSLQWEIYHASLDPVEGSEQAGSRPVLVISREVINQTLPIAAVLPLTSYKPNRRIYATEVFLPRGTGGVLSDSLVLAHQIRTLARSRLGKRYGVLVDRTLQEKVRLAVRIFLDL